MFCIYCIEEGKESVVYPGSTWGTMMASVPYYDKNGVYHDHGPNTYTTDYSCSNGHRWKVERNRNSITTKRLKDIKTLQIGGV